MKKALLLLFILSGTLNASPRMTFNEALFQGEMFPEKVIQAREEAIRQELPLNILTSDRIMCDVKAIEDGKIVYSVFTNLANVYDGGYTAFCEEVASRYNLSASRLDYGNGNIIDNTGGMYEPVYTSAENVTVFLMIPDWTGDKVYLFSAANGDLVDANFIPTTNPQLQSPKHALQHFNGIQILVSDQLSDVVQRFDTSGAYINVFAPSGGVNNAILDNIRGIAYKPNNNLLVCNASGASSNRIQEFDTAGVFVASFISTNVSSPFGILYRTTDILISNSSGGADITKFTFSGTFIADFYNGANIAFAQQMYQLPDGRVIVAGFSSPSGLILLDSNGNYIRTLTGVTGNRGVYLLDNGNYLTTNGTGVHEIDSTTGNLVRTITTGSSFQYASTYIPGGVVSVGNEIGNIPKTFKLYNNYPNPFNPVTNIKFTVPKDGNVSLKIYDMLGRLVDVYMDGFIQAGYYNAEVDGTKLTSGVYFYTLKADDYSETKKMLLIK